MDDEIDYDDLFGEEPALPLPPPPTAKGLLARVDELRTTGCCQKLAWSKIGCVAQITPDGHGVVVRNLVCDPQDGKWSLSQDHPIPPVQPEHEAHQLVHLSWNHTGSELAVMDALGRISVFAIVMAMNRMQLSRSPMSDQEDDLGAIAGMIWLSSDRQFALYRPAVKIEGQFQYGLNSCKPFGPHPAHNKAALVCATRGGTLRLLYQQPDSRWLEVNCEIETIASSNEVLSHASFCSDHDNSLLLLVRTTSHQYRLYRINIDWKTTPNQQTLPTSQTSYSPVIVIHPVKIPLSSLEAISLQSPTGDGVPPQLQLSHLELIPTVPLPHKNNKFPPPQVLLVLSSVPPLDLPTQQDPQSVVVRCEISNVAQTLHITFDQLGSKKNGTSSVQNQCLDIKRLDEIVVNKTVLGIHHGSASSVIAFMFSDGSIDFRDRQHMTLVNGEENPDRISNIQQVGFAFASDDPCLHIAISPCSCLALGADSEGSVNLKVMQYNQGALEASPENSKFANVVVALALQFAYSCTNHVNNDDIRVLLERLGNTYVEQHFVNEIYRALNMSVDHSVESQAEKLFRNNILQRCLSMQDSLGFEGDRSHREAPAKLAWLTLHLRQLALIFTYTFGQSGTTSGGQPTHDFTKPEVLQSLFGLIKWSFDFINYLVDDLYELANLLKGHYTDEKLLKDTREFLEDISSWRTDRTQVLQRKSCVLSLLFCSIPRTCIRRSCRGLRAVSISSLKGMEQEQDKEQRQSYSSMLDVVSASPLKVPPFERLLADLDTSIKTTYKEAGVSDAERALIEKKMLISAEIPEMLMPVVEKLLTTSLADVRSEIDPAALYFADYSWLGLGIDKKSESYRRNTVVDAMRKRCQAEEVYAMLLVRRGCHATTGKQSVVVKHPKSMFLRKPVDVGCAGSLRDELAVGVCLVERGMQKSWPRNMTAPVA
ncbi:MAG: mediator complex subunit [Piccolia ochrophora]|nr:MAG: mediator complex subunit [Piccolia ochrophora]